MMVAERTGTRSQPIGAVLRRKRSDTHVGTIERQYGLDFGVRSDMHLGTLLKRRSTAWLDEMLQAPPQNEEEAEAEAA
jgi:hypothetical protein